MSNNPSLKESNPYHTFKAHGDLQLAEYIRSVHYLWAPPGITLEQATDVRSFAHIAAKLKPNDEIIIRSENDDYYARVLVRFVRNYDVSVTVIEKVTLKPEKITGEDTEFEVSYINGRYKWGFKRKGTSDWIAKEIPTEQQAMNALEDHRKALAA